MNVEFEDPSYTASKKTFKKGVSFSQLVVSMGLAKDEKGAQTVLVVIAVLCFIVAGALYFLAQPPEVETEFVPDIALAV